MLTRLSATTTIVLAAGIWGASLWVFGVDLSWEHAKPFSVTVLLVTAALTSFDRVLWRWWPCRLFHGVPDIAGDWTVELRSSYSFPGEDRERATVTGNATITQTFSSLSIRLKTKSSTSFLLAERIICHGDGACEVIGVYQGDPSIHLRGTLSEIHYGAFRYRVVGVPPTEMSGHYWTDRSTSGSIRLVRKQTS